MRTVKTDQTGQTPRLIRIFAGHTCHFVGYVMMRLISFGTNKHGETVQTQRRSLIRVHRHIVCYFFYLQFLEQLHMPLQSNSLVQRKSIGNFWYERNHGDQTKSQPPRKPGIIFHNLEFIKTSKIHKFRVLL